MGSAAATAYHKPLKKNALIDWCASQFSDEYTMMHKWIPGLNFRVKRFWWLNYHAPANLCETGKLFIPFLQARHCLFSARWFCERIPCLEVNFSSPNTAFRSPAGVDHTLHTSSSSNIGPAILRWRPMSLKLVNRRISCIILQLSVRIKWYRMLY